MNSIADLRHGILADERLSYKAIGIFVQLLANSTNGYVTGIDLKDSRQKDGRDSIASGVKELEKLGYLQRKTVRDSNGRFVSKDYLVVNIAGFYSN